MWGHVFFALLSLTYGELIHDENLYFLDDLNWMEAVKEPKDMFVMFYEPKCGHYKRLLPEMKKVAASFKDQSDILLGQYDMGHNKHIGVAYDIKAGPSFHYFSGKVHYEYTGPQTASDITQWVKLRLSPKVKLLRSYPDVQQFISENPTVFVLFADEDSEASNELAKAIKFEQNALIGISIHPVALSVYKYANPSFVVFKKNDYKTKVFEGELKADKLKAFIDEEKYGWVLPFGDAAYEYFFDNNKPGLFVFRNSSQSELDEIVDELALTHHGKIKFSIGDLHQHLTFAELLGVNPDKQPFAMIIKPINGVLRKYPADKAAKEELGYLIKEWEDGTAKQFYKSQLAPDDDSLLTTSNFKKLVPSAEKDVLVHFYAPWCMHCRVLEKQLDEVLETIGNDTLSIYAIDAMANDIPGHDIFSFPTLKLFKAGESSGIEYTNKEKKAEDIIEFIKKNRVVSSEYKPRPRDQASKKESENQKKEDL
ncbi:unnamed protein product [Blepharisma stoltei]|uniref:protein disulfide-isomerase n=1 Tax=Blepharisma stoltei TaxID=1481888 RepID=A0AAU9JKI0_9CILI|nr:unnamed protein product [Blepharisma stoltei]